MSGLNSINNGYGTLSAGVADTDPNPLTIVLTAGHGARMPAASSAAGSWFIGALINEPPNAIEFVKVYNRSTDTLTALGGWGGTARQTWAGGTRFAALTDEMSAQGEYLDLLQMRHVVVAGGTADALTASLTTAHTVIQSGMRLLLLIASPNTTATATLALTFSAAAYGASTTGTGAKRIVLEGDRYIGPGDLSAGMLADLVYNAAYQGGSGAWVLQNPAGGHDRPGTLKMVAGASLPAGAWFWADGSIKAEATYVGLFAAIGTAFNRGDEGAGNFRLPDMRGRTPVGVGTGVAVEHVTASSANGFTVDANNTKLITGMPVVLSNLTGFTTGATAGPTYYIYRASATNVRLCSTLAIAQNATTGSMVTISGTGTATLTYTLTERTLGEDGGEQAHAMSSTELLAHTHTIPAAADPNFGGSEHFGKGGVGGTFNDPTSSTGGNAGMNIMQPFLAVNFAIRY